MALDSDWQRTYAPKITTAEQAIANIRPGRRILIGSGAAEPMCLVEALVANSHHLADNEIVHILTLGPAPYIQASYAHRFRHTAFFIGPNVREAVQDGRADYMPVFLSEIPGLIRSRRVRIDVAMVQVSPPDRHGYVSLGVSVDVVRAAVNTADLVIAEVNPQMPRTHGDSFVPMSQIDFLVPVDTPLFEFAPLVPGPVESAIGAHVASLVPDRATIQAGIGEIPNALLRELAGRHDIGVHTEMLSDGIMELALAGVITGRAKTLLPGKMVTSFVMGSRKLYEWVHENPAVEMRATDFVNDPLNIARNDRMISINTALAVDLTGQVAADTLGGRFFSGVGGQVDFVRGAARSRDGKSIIAFPSTAKNGTVSRITAALEAGTGVVTSRADVRYVVTEYGIADLWGKSIRERANALIGIAHPDFRQELTAQARARRYIFPDQIVPRAVYPWKEECIKQLRDGASVLLRPVKLTDEETLQDFLYGLSNESVYRRYLMYKRTHPHEEMQALVDVDYHQSMALVAIDLESDRIIGVSRYDVDPATNRADIAFVVGDDWQGRGLGTLLFRRMAEIAFSNGIAGFQADVLATNTPMLRVFYRSGHKVTAKLEHGVYHLEVRFDPATMFKRDSDAQPHGRGSQPS